jgi:hypothetical protein
MFLIHGDESRYADATPEQWDAMLQAHNAWSAKVTEAGGVIVAGEALAPSGTSTTVRNGSTPVVTDGPFIETKEALGGFYTVDCADLDQALAFAQTLPGDVVEVRPVIPTR